MVQNPKEENQRQGAFFLVRGGLLYHQDPGTQGHPGPLQLIFPCRLDTLFYDLPMTFLLQAMCYRAFICWEWGHRCTAIAKPVQSAN